MQREEKYDNKEKSPSEKSSAYKYDNPHIEHRSKRELKLEALELKYNHRPAIIIHTLSDDGNKKLIQMKRDRILTTLGWSFIGNFGGVLAVGYLDSTKRFKMMQNFRRKEVYKIFTFIGTVMMFTYYGFAKARQEFIKQKLKIVEEYSVSKVEK